MAKAEEGKRTLFDGTIVQYVRTSAVAIRRKHVIICTIILFARALQGGGTGPSAQFDDGFIALLVRNCVP